MGKINIGRVIVGGLVAGLFINVAESLLNLVIIADRMDLVYRELNLPQPSGGAIVVFFVLGFLLGILTIWLYAAIRPRFGPGPRTAILTALFVWLFAYLWPALGDAMMGILDPDLLVFVSVWGMFEILAASVAGAWFYREAGDPEP
ncbi:MAG: hypothetical protein PVI01_12900 [Gemmatimonadales bacterium]|jgi:hypothetical protein